MAAEIQHGSFTGVDAHNKAHEHYCLPCAAFEVDRGRAYRVRAGRTKRLQVTAHLLADILAGDDPREALAREIGPQTLAVLEALRTPKAVAQHG